MVKVQKDSENTPITKEEEEEIEAIIEKAKELGWDKDRLFRQLSSMGYSYAFGVQPEGYRNYLEDRLSGKTNIKVTSEFNFFEQLDKELAALESKPTPTDAKADIERRRKEDLKTFGSTAWGSDLKQRFLEKFGVEVNGWGSSTTDSDSTNRPDSYTVYDLRKIINAKYDAELARELYKEMKAGKTEMTPEGKEIENRRSLTTISDEDATDDNYDGYYEDSVKPSGSDEFVKTGKWIGTYINKAGEKEEVVANSEKELLDILNAKYDAELDALQETQPTETYKGIEVIDSSSIKAATGEPGAAQFNRAENKILINRELLKKKFDEKAWTKPRKQKDGSFATALSENTFPTYDAWEKFVIEHEFQHSLLSYEESGATNIGQYEDIINSRALGEEAKPTELKVGDKVKVNTPKDGEGVIKEDRGDKVLLEDGRQVYKKNLTLLEETVKEKSEDLRNSDNLTNLANEINFDDLGLPLPKVIKYSNPPVNEGDINNLKNRCNVTK